MPRELFEGTLKALNYNARVLVGNTTFPKWRIDRSIPDSAGSDVKPHCQPFPFRESAGQGVPLSTIPAMLKEQPIAATEQDKTRLVMFISYGWRLGRHVRTCFVFGLQHS
jgi:hypothetical protein